MAAQGWGGRWRWPWQHSAVHMDQRSSSLRDVAYWAAEWQAQARRVQAYIAEHGLAYDPAGLEELRRACRLAERRYWRAVEEYTRQRAQTRRVLARLRCLVPPQPPRSRAA
jgi:hypothetical protein